MAIQFQRVAFRGPTHPGPTHPGPTHTELSKVLLSAAGALATAALATSVFAPTASAQENVADTIPNAVENISENRSGDYYTHLTVFSKLSFILGLGGFPEQRANDDAAALSAAYQELMTLQTQNTATIRVPDLPNPYTSSVQLLPASQNNSRVIGSELNFEPLPRR
ncbi:MAG: hypothetical protein HC800_14000 [Phormidesmis sp. RL_2_1]|nr:hypothetical protein [Phormidesmis sp. RL_2_1]